MKHRPYALQAEVSPQHAYIVAQISWKEYALSKKGGYSLGLKLQYIPDHTKLFHHRAKTKFDHTLTRQLNFIDNVESTICPSISCINHPSTSVKVKGKY